jgi:uncharacterized protein
MKKLVFILLLFCVSPIFSQKITDTITSQKLNEDREIYIGLPPSYDKTKNQKYPILLVLDGEFLFDAFDGALKYGNYWDDLPEVILVGISQNKNNERETDCTVEETTGLPEEKGEQFFEFIGMELLPYIEKNFRTAPFKIIAGLDNTAAFINFYLYKDIPLFDAYISMSPELYPEMEVRVPERLAAIEKQIYYYHAVAEGDVKKMRERIKQLDTEASKIIKPTLNYRFDDFKGASHYSLVLFAIPSALYQIFAVYQPISTVEFQEKIAPMTSGYVDYLIKKYDVLEKAYSLKLQMRLSDIKAMEAAILKNKAYHEFEALSQLARKNYPNTMLADYHLGTMYEMKGDTKKAAKAYQTAFQKQEIGDLTKDMMLEKADEMKNGGKPKETTEEVLPATETPTDAPPAETPTETPTETPKEEKKSE